MNEACVVPDYDGAAEQQGRRQFAVFEPVGGPQTRTIAATPRHDRAIALGTEQGLPVSMHAIGTTGRLRPSHCASGSIDTTHSRLEGTCTDGITYSAGTPNQLNQSLNIVGPPRTRQRSLPTNAAIVWIQTYDTAGKPRNQGISNSQQNARLAQNQRLTGALLTPEFAARHRIKCRQRTIGRKHKYAPTRNERGREYLRSQ
ncbi:MAG: hypothetical protein A2Z90_03730 [Burkholderiales bacterium GWA2_64_37]|nr:MAG: hypothetical protein A2Z90_03730 [Burkholderiales bacterium GWA2_64_37]